MTVAMAASRPLVAVQTTASEGCVGVHHRQQLPVSVCDLQRSTEVSAPLLVTSKGLPVVSACANAALCPQSR
eukprot:scaffold340_cov256-Pinguiococcus_pyrenoidosus.AAC.54